MTSIKYVTAALVLCATVQMSVRGAMTVDVMKEAVNLELELLENFPASCSRSTIQVE